VGGEGEYEHAGARATNTTRGSAAPLKLACSKRGAAQLYVALNAVGMVCGMICMEVRGRKRKEMITPEAISLLAGACGKISARSKRLERKSENVWN
jgi:hypothetical protein